MRKQKKRRKEKQKRKKKEKQTMAGVPAGRGGIPPSSTRECRNALITEGWGGCKRTGVLWTPSWDHLTTPGSSEGGRDVDGTGGCRRDGGEGERGRAQLIRESLLLLTHLPLGMQLIIAQGPAASQRRGGERETYLKSIPSTAMNPWSICLIVPKQGPQVAKHHPI